MTHLRFWEIRNPKLSGREAPKGGSKGVSTHPGSSQALLAPQLTTGADTALEAGSPDLSSAANQKPHRRLKSRAIKQGKMNEPEHKSSSRELSR